MAVHQISENLLGVIDIMRGRPGGMKRMDLTPEGFWNSFYGLLLAALIDTASLSIAHGQLDAATAPGKVAFVTVNLASALLGYAMGMLALFLLCRSASEKRGFPTALAVHNWAGAVVSAAIFPLFILRGTGCCGPSTGLGTVIGVTVMFALVVIGIRILRISLLLTPARAALFFAITTFVSIVVQEGFEGLLGF